MEIVGHAHSGGMAGIQRAGFLSGLCAVLAARNSPASARPKTVLSIGWQPNFGGARGIVAYAAGIFDRNGLDVRPAKFLIGSEYFAAFAAGQIDIGWLGTPPAGTGIAQGLPMRIFAIEGLARDQEGLIVRSNSGIRSVRDLKGKRVATKRGSSADVALQAALRRAGLSPADIVLMDLGVREVVQAFKTGRIDGAWYWEPWQGLLRESGGVQVATDRDAGAVVGWVWVARPAWMERQPAAVLAILRSLDEAAWYMREHPERAAKLCAKELNVSQSLALRVLVGEGAWPTMRESWHPAYPLSLNPQTLHRNRGVLSALGGTVSPDLSGGRLETAIDWRSLARYLGVQPAS